jgi:C4-dicarboxylate transporter DctQ subunit
MSAPPPERAAAGLWRWAERILVGLLGLAALLAGSVQVLGRYLVPAHAISWAEEVIVYLLVWAVMIVASELARSDGHVRPDVVLRLLPPQGQRWLEIANSLIAVIFCTGLAYYGWQIVSTAWLLDERSATDLQFPMWLYYLALPVGGGLMALRYLGRLRRYLFAFDARRMTIGRNDATRTE